MILSGILGRVLSWIISGLVLLIVYKSFLIVYRSCFRRVCRHLKFKKWCYASEQCTKCVGRGICPHWKYLERCAKHCSMDVEELIKKYGDH